ncbi:TetR/AcrR family transcriptional regulator [Microlunatus flavus]|uniref:DNA-binding transcriptional regulator, AcrR family n=1 Tax=Microlunatus flavus TaxID=1036181 RepID=A0A1H9IFU4_9ACTN|nr:TetR/AcrR family transcriptional regulator [Microlunatus flavus]SEQ73463.1 DNA-binding transcriptional regulator, AcrR family [Microlunatus flavus]
MAATLTTRGRETRQRIIEATGQQILAGGIGGTTLDGVRAATLTSKSQLFHYFPGGKTELVREVAAWEGQQLLDAQLPWLDDLSTWESWHAWRDALVDYYLRLGRWACPIGSLAWEAAATDPALAGFVADAMRLWRGKLADGIRRMSEAGHLEAGVDADRMAAAILAAVQGGLMLSQPERSSWPLEAALDSLLDVLRSRTLPEHVDAERSVSSLKQDAP